MHLEPASVVEGQLADGALERLLTGVDPLVLGEVRLLLEALVADGADERPLVGVDPHVVLKRTPRVELLPDGAGRG